MKLHRFYSLLALAAILSLGPLSGQAQYHFYMTIVGKQDGAFKGASTKAKHKPILEAPVIMAISRKDAGSSKNGQITFTKQVDESSPAIWQAHTSNEVLPEISFMVYKPGDDSKWKVITFNNAVINGVTVKKVAKDPNGRAKANQQPAPSNTTDLEEISFNYQKISIEYYSGGSVSTTDDWNTPGQ